VTGAEILSEDEADSISPAIVAAPVLYATSAGHQAFQQPNPEKGLSIFGRALLDGLVGTPDIDLDDQGNFLSVKLYPLEGYLKGRVIELLKAAQANVYMPVNFAGNRINNEHITYLEGRRAAPMSTPPPSRSQDLVAAGLPEASPRTLRIEASLNNPFTVTYEVPANISRSRWASNFNIGHDLFGSEHVTEVWSKRLSLYGLGKREWLDVDKLRLHKVVRDPETRVYRAELSIEDRDTVGHWIQLVDTSNLALGCLVPGDRHAPPRYVLEFDVQFEEKSGGGRRITRLDSYLSRSSPLTLQQTAAELWQRYRTSDIGEVISAFEHSSVHDEMKELHEWLRHDSSPDLTEKQLRSLHDAVRSKMESPLAATIASLILFRANRFDLLHNWVRNLANWFPERPDGAVLWAEQVMRQEEDRDKAIAEAAEYITRLLDHGFPQTSEGMAYAASLIDRLMKSIDRVPQELQLRLERLHGNMENTLIYFRPGGLFCSYAAFEPNIDPMALIGSTAVEV
jgi:hypothetical protein